MNHTIYETIEEMNEEDDRRNRAYESCKAAALHRERTTPGPALTVTMNQNQQGKPKLAPLEAIIIASVIIAAQSAAHAPKDA